MRRALHFLLMAACAALVSCIDGREELWVNPDGSGRAELRYEIPQAAAVLRSREEIDVIVAAFLERNAAIFQEREHRVVRTEDGLAIEVAVEFDSAADLAHLDVSGKNVPPVVRHLAGEFALERRGRTVEFERTVTVGRAIPGWRFMPRSQFENRRLIHIIHLPEPAETSNATRTDHEGRTLVWDHSLAEALREPVTTRFRAKIPLPRWLAGAGFALVALLAAAAVSLRRVLRRRVA